MHDHAVGGPRVQVLRHRAAALARVSPSASAVDNALSGLVRSPPLAPPPTAGAHRSGGLRGGLASTVANNLEGVVRMMQGAGLRSVSPHAHPPLACHWSISMSVQHRNST